jgi:hypothetical protein
MPLLQKKDVLPPQNLLLLVDCLHAFPAPTQPLLPQANAVVARAHGKHIAAQTPTHAPGDRLDVQGR